MGTIVVGVDGSSGARRALDWALEEARLRSAKVRVVHAIQPVVVPAHVMGRAGGYVGPTEQEQQEAGEQLVEEMLGTAGATVPVERTITFGESPAQVLMGAADEADLLVVGSRGLGGFQRLLLGSVSHQCVSHATCPVTVVPAAQE